MTMKVTNLDVAPAYDVGGEADPSVTPQGRLRVDAGPANDAKVVAPNDATDLPGGTCRALMPRTTGNVAFVTRVGTTITLLAVPAFTVVPIAASRVLSTGTTAEVLALY